jgi:hypothetical protein
MTLRRSFVLAVGLALIAPLVSLPAEAETTTVVGAARGWLLFKQEADGGFEVADFPGFETPDAVLALASANAEFGAWDPAANRDEIAGLDAPGGGPDPIEHVEALIDDEANPTTVAAGARAAKVAALVAQPLGFPASAFDPSNDGAVDLFARMDEHRDEDGSYDFGAQFNGALYVAIALAGDDREVPAGLVQQIRDAQRADGSWDFSGTPGESSNDIDTTALALIALRSAGLTTADADVAAGVAYLASRQQASGAWQAYGADDPNATAMAAIALSDLRIDVSTPAWRAAAGSTTTGASTSPQAWLASQQANDGRIASPNDEYGVNTFATSQAVQALGGQWYLAGELDELLVRWSEDLASPLSGAVVGAGSADAAPVLAPNPSFRSARSAAATAVVNGVDGRKAAAADLFAAAFGRTIDPSGSTYWSNQLVTRSRPEVLARLTGSSEFYRRAGGTIPSFVDRVYQSVLGRTPDPSGRAYWISRLERGGSVWSVARNLTASSEYRRKQATAAYQRVLDRAPTVGERDYWTGRLASTRIEVLLAALASSPELYASLEA